MTKIFCDIADIQQIRKFNKKKIVKGFTTNPSLMRKAGAKDYKNYSLKINKITKKPVSFEVLADNEKQMISQGLKINTWGKNVFVKVPICNSNGKFMGRVIRTLNEKNIKLNITAVYSHHQTKKILRMINKKTQVIISIFAGRLGDSGKDPTSTIKSSVSLSKRYKNVQILWASTREALHYVKAKKLGCHIITMPPDIINKIESFGLTRKELSIKTVSGFLVDSKKSKFIL